MSKTGTRHTGGPTAMELQAEELRLHKLNKTHELELKYQLKKYAKTMRILHASAALYISKKNLLYLPVEIAITAFNVKDGIVDQFCTLIDPGEIPTGYGIEVRSFCKETAFPYPPFDSRLQNYSQIIENLERFYEVNYPGVEQPKLYCMPENIKEIAGSFDWLYAQVDRKCPFQFFSFAEAMRLMCSILVDFRSVSEATPKYLIKDRIVEARVMQDAVVCGTTCDTYAYSRTLTEIGNTYRSELRSQSEWHQMRAGIFVHEMQVVEYLKHFYLMFEPALSCVFHYHSDYGIENCALNRTNRNAYNMLDSFINIAKIQPILTKHVPEITNGAQKEMDRREELLSKWNLIIRIEKEFRLYPNSSPKENKDTHGNFRPM